MVHPRTHEGLRMTTATADTVKPKSKHETWRSWMPPGTPEPEPLLTRVELLDRLHSEGIDVSETSLVYWEKEGILPRAVRRWHGGKPATLYPEWLIPAVNTVRIMQDRGESLAEIRATIRSIYRLPLSEDEQIARNTAYDAALKALIEPLAALVQQWEHWSNQELESVRILLRTTDGAEVKYNFDPIVQRVHDKHE